MDVIKPQYVIIKPTQVLLMTPEVYLSLPEVSNVTVDWSVIGKM